MGGPRPAIPAGGPAWRPANAGRTDRRPGIGIRPAVLRSVTSRYPDCTSVRRSRPGTPRCRGAGRRRRGPASAFGSGDEDCSPAIDRYTTERRAAGVGRELGCVSPQCGAVYRRSRDRGDPGPPRATGASAAGGRDPGPVRRGVRPRPVGPLGLRRRRAGRARRRGDGLPARRDARRDVQGTASAGKPADGMDEGTIEETGADAGARTKSSATRFSSGSPS